MEEAIIVVTEDEESARAAEELVLRWSGTGLLKPIYWIVATSGAQSDDDLSIPARYIAGGVAREVDLLSHLALRTVTGARVIAFALADGIGDTGLVGDRAEWIFDVLRRQGGLPVFRLAVLVPITGSAAVGDDAAIREGWTVVVASPEDRPRDEQRSFARPITREDSLASHAAFALCVNGGLWAAMVGGPFDQGGAFASGGQANIRVTRAFGRLIFGDAVLEAVVARTLAIPASWPAPVESEKRIPKTGDAASVVRRITDDLMTVSDGALTYDPFVTPPAQPELLPSVGEIIARFFRFLGRSPRDLRADLRTAGAQRSEALARQLTLGVQANGGGSGQGVEACSVAEMGTVASRIFDATQTAVTGTDGIAVAAPELWRAVHGAALGMVDGSAMPSGVGAVKMADGTAVVVTEADLVVPAPDDTFRPEVDAVPERWRNDGTLPDEIGFVDVFTARRLRRALAQPAYRWVEPEETSEVDGAPVTTDAPAPAEAVPGATAGPDVPGDGTTPDTPTVAPELLAQIQSQTASALRRLDEWEARRRDSLLWNLADRTARSVEQAAGDVDRAMAVLAAGVPDPDRAAVEAVQRKARQGIAWTALAALLAVAAIVVLATQAVFSPVAALLWGVVALLAALGASFGFFIRYHRQERQLVDGPKRAAREFEIAADRLVHATRGLIQVTSHYQQLQRWAEVIARVARSPWAVASAAAPPDRSDLETPLALAIATGLASDDIVSALVGQAGRKVYRRGWLTECFADLVRHVEEDYKRRYAVDVVPPAETDRPQVQVETMDMLIAATRKGVTHDQEFRRLRKVVVDTLNGQPLEMLFDQCEQTGSVQGYDEDRVVMAAEEFLTDVRPVDDGHNFVTKAFEDAGVVEGRHGVSAHRIWSTETVDLGPSVKIQEERAERSADVAGIYSLLLRLDVSDALTRDDVSIFTESIMSGAPSALRKTKFDIPAEERD